MRIPHEIHEVLEKRKEKIENNKITVKELYETLGFLLEKGIDCEIFIANGNKYTSNFVLEIGQNIYIEPTEKILDK